MAVRQDWTRFTRIIHDVLASPRLDLRKSLRPSGIATTSTVQFVAGNVVVARDRKLLAEIDRRKNRVLVNNLRNQIR